MKESINGTYCQIIAFHLSFIHLQLQVWDGHVLITVTIWACSCHCTDVDMSLSLYRCGHILVTVQMWTCPRHCKDVLRHMLITVQMCTWPCLCTDVDMSWPLSPTHSLLLHSFHSFPIIIKPYTLHFPHLIDF